MRGGSYTYASSDVGYDWDLEGVRWTQDVAVSGTVSWDMSTNIITADVSLKNGGKALGTLKIRWNDADINAVATVSGKIQGATLNAKRIAP